MPEYFVTLPKYYDEGVAKPRRVFRVVAPSSISAKCAVVLELVPPEVRGKARVEMAATVNRTLTVQRIEFIPCVVCKQDIERAKIAEHLKPCYRQWKEHYHAQSEEGQEDDSDPDNDSGSDAG